MNFKDAVEIIGNLSQLLLCGLGALVFWQIKIAKDEITIAKNDLKIRCQRDARARSMELGEKFAKEIVPKVSDFQRLIDGKKFKIKLHSLKNFYLEEITDAEKVDYDRATTLLGENPDLYKETVDILNLFESLALNFTKGVADEEVMFTALADVYCRMVESCFAFLCSRRRKNSLNPYENIVELYQIWSNRMREKGLHLARESIMIQLSEVESNRSQKITPIGL